MWALFSSLCRSSELPLPAPWACLWHGQWLRWQLRWQSPRRASSVCSRHGSSESRTFITSCMELGVSCSCSLLCEAFPDFQNSREPPPSSHGWKRVQSCGRSPVPQFCVTGPTCNVERGRELEFYSRGLLATWASFHGVGFSRGFWLPLCHRRWPRGVPGGREGSTPHPRAAQSGLCSRFSVQKDSVFCSVCCPALPCDSVIPPAHTRVRAGEERRKEATWSPCTESCHPGCPPTWADLPNPLAAGSHQEQVFTPCPWFSAVTGGSRGHLYWAYSAWSPPGNGIFYLKTISNLGLFLTSESVKRPILFLNLQHDFTSQDSSSNALSVGGEEVLCSVFIGT